MCSLQKEKRKSVSHAVSQCVSVSNNLHENCMYLSSFLIVGVNNLLSGRVVSVQTDYYSYEFVLRKLEARV